MNLVMSIVLHYFVSPQFVKTLVLQKNKLSGVYLGRPAWHSINHIHQTPSLGGEYSY